MNKKLFSFMMIIVLGKNSLHAAEGNRFGRWVDNFLPHAPRFNPQQNRVDENIPAAVEIQQAPQIQPLPQAQPLLTATQILWQSLETNYPDGVAQAITLGANVNATDDHGNTPLHKAAFDLQVEIVRILLENGANINAENWINSTPWREGLCGTDLHWYNIDRWYQTATILVEHLKDVNTSNSKGETPLHTASNINGPSNIVNLLLDRGANPNAQNEKGQTPLHYTCYRLNPEIIHTLLNRGADITIKNNQEENPFENGLNYHLEYPACSDPAGLKEFIKLCVGTTYDADARQGLYKLEEVLTTFNLDLKTLSPETQSLLSRLCTELNQEVDTKPAKGIALDQ